MAAHNNALPNGWREVRLGDVIQINPAVPLPKGTVAKKINMDIIVPFRKKILSHTIDTYNGGAKFKNGDTLMARITPCLENGKISFVDILQDDEVAFGSTEFIVLREMPNITDKNFIYYLATSPDLMSHAIKSMTGASGRQRVPIDEVGDYTFLLPPLAEQHAIAEVLSSLDDKIDLLHRQNQTLEDMAQALFRRWFVEGTDGKRETKRLGDFFPIVTGKKNSHYATDNGKYPFFTCAQGILKAPHYSFEGNAILLTGNGYFNVKRYIGKFEAYQRTYVLIPYEPKYTAFLYTLIKYYLPLITGGSHGSVIDYLTKDMIEDFMFDIPKNNFDARLHYFDTLYQKIDANNTTIDIARELSDTLLPKLISGKVSLL